MKSSVRVAIMASAFVVAFLRYPSLAEACSGPSCWHAQLFPADGQMVPANIPALVYRTTSSHGKPISLTPPVRWTDPAGADVPFEKAATAEGFLLLPTQPLKLNTWYSVEYPDLCPYGQRVESPLMIRQYFKTFESKAFAPTLTVEVSSLGNEDLWVGASAVCSEEVDAAVARLLIKPPLEWVWAGTAIVETKVDGKRWSVSLPGALSSDGTLTWDPLGIPWNQKRPDVLYAGCIQPDGMADLGLSQGPHSVEVTFTLPGKEPIVASASLSIELTCQAPLPDEITSAEIGPEEADQPESSAAEEAEATAMPANGCSARHSAVRNSLAAYGFLALAALALARGFLTHRRKPRS